MNKIVKIIMIFIISFVFLQTANAQAPPPPPPDHGQTGNQPGGNAPIGGGLFILLALGASYGIKKVYDIRKETLED